MSKYIFKTVPKSVLDHHNLADTSKLHYVSAYGDLMPVYLAQDPTLRESLETKIITQTVNTLVGKGYKKAFIIPDCPAKQDRLKMALTETSLEEKQRRLLLRDNQIKEKLQDINKRTIKKNVPIYFDPVMKKTKRKMKKKRDRKTKNRIKV